MKHKDWITLNLKVKVEIIVKNRYKNPKYRIKKNTVRILKNCIIGLLSS